MSWSGLCMVLTMSTAPAVAPEEAAASAAIASGAQECGPLGPGLRGLVVLGASVRAELFVGRGCSFDGRERWAGRCLPGSPQHVDV